MNENEPTDVRKVIIGSIMPRKCFLTPKNAKNRMMIQKNASRTLLVTKVVYPKLLDDMSKRVLRSAVTKKETVADGIRVSLHYRLLKLRNRL